MRTRWTPHPRAMRAAIASAVAVTVLAAAGCTSGDDEPESPARSGARAGDEPDRVRTEVTVGEVVGRLPRRDATRAARAVGEVVDRWIDAGYLAEEVLGAGQDGQPGAKVLAGALPGWTEGARRLARDDLWLVSNLRLGTGVEDVRATRRRVAVDLLAVARRPVTATARLLVALRTSGEVRRVERLTGRILLSRSRGDWRVFGYDLARGAVKGDGR